MIIPRLVTMAVPRMSWPLHRVSSEDTEYETDQYYNGEKKDVVVETRSISGDSTSEVIGSTEIFDEYGNIRLIPVSFLRGQYLPFATIC